MLHSGISARYRLDSQVDDESQGLVDVAQLIGSDHAPASGQPSRGDDPYLVASGV